jgi:hypothetical protein
MSRRLFFALFMTEVLSSLYSAVADSATLARVVKSTFCEDFQRAVYLAAANFRKPSLDHNLSEETIQISTPR